MINKNARGNIIYTPELIDELRELVKGMERAEGVKAVGKHLKVKERTARETYARYIEKGEAPKITVPVVVASLKGRKIRRLFYDLETSPNVVFSWRVGRKINLDYDNIIKERAVICVCWKWQGDKTVKSLTWDGSQNDRAMLAEFVGALNEADEAIGHNLARFDFPWVKTRCLYHGLPPIADTRIVDTLKWARSKFAFNSNRLDYLGQFLGLGGKLKTGFGLWKKIVLEKDEKALAQMVTYCKRDVDLLEKVWEKLAAWCAPDTHIGVLGGNDKWTNPRTGSTNVRVYKTRISAMGGIKYQMQDLDDGTFYHIGPKAHEAYIAAKTS